MEKEIDLSILIPAYNNTECLIRALDSIKDQTIAKKIHVSISDDCSPKKINEKKILNYREYFKSLKFFRQSENLGVLSNASWLFNQVETDLYTFLQHDDYIYNKNFYESALNAFSENKNLVFFYGNAVQHSFLEKAKTLNEIIKKSKKMYDLSNRKLIEANKPINKIRFRQIQGLGKITKEMISKSDLKLNSYMGINLSKSESFLSEDRIGLIKGGGDKGVLQTGYIDTGINIFSKRKKINLQGNLSLLQSISGLTPYDQRKNLRNDNIPLSKAKAIITRLDFEKIFNSKISFNSQFNSQIALGKLPSDMSFSFGGEDGFSSLPSSIGSGDSGWFLISSFSREIANNTKYSLKVSPFFGMGLIHKSSPGEENDYVGSGGIKMLLEKENINIELGLVEKFLTENNSGSWNNWLLSNGIYTKLAYKF